MEYLKENFEGSIARACRLISLPRSTYEHRVKEKAQDEALRERMKELAAKHRRFGVPRLHALLRAEGLVANHKRSERIYAEEKLQVRRRKRKKLARFPRLARPQASRPDEVWSMDFVHDWTAKNRKLKCLTIVDDFTRESVGIFPAHSMSGAEVTRCLETLGRLPQRLRSDNGPEFVSTAMLAWAEKSKIEHEYITPGKPNENAFIESFNARFRDECLNEHIFFDLGDAREKIEGWRQSYNEIHPHSSLGMRSPKSFALEWKKMISANAG